MGLENCIYREPSYDPGLARSVLIGPAPMTVITGIRLDQSEYCDAESHLLEGILGQLESLSVKIAHDTILLATVSPSLAESAVEDAALAWMPISLEDVAAQVFVQQTI